MIPEKDSRFASFLPFCLFALFSLLACLFLSPPIGVSRAVFPLEWKRTREEVARWPRVPSRAAPYLPAQAGSAAAEAEAEADLQKSDRSTGT